MGERRRQEGRRKRDSDNWGPPASNNRSWYYGKPPRVPNGMCEVPQWEKDFCKAEGVLWGNLLETKRYLHQYSDITGWDDSAGKETFDNAKARYWAWINGSEPAIQLPDPDAYIDEVDHDKPPAELKLYENMPGSLSDEEGEDNCNGNSDDWGPGGVILWDSHYAKNEEDVAGWGDIVTGWGDNLIIPTGWGDIPTQPNPQSNSWGVIPTGWGDNPVNPTGWGDMPGDLSPETPKKGIIPTGWGDAEEGARECWNNNWNQSSWYESANAGMATAYWNNDEVNWNSGMNDGNWVGWNQNSGYDYSQPGETGQCWNYSRNYWNNGRVNEGNWEECNQNSRFDEGNAGEAEFRNYSGDRGYKKGWNKNGGGRCGWNKNGNKNLKNTKQWRKKNDFNGNLSSDSSRRFCAPLNQTTQCNDAWNVPRTVA